MSSAPSFSVAAVEPARTAVASGPNGAPLPGAAPTTPIRQYLGVGVADIIGRTGDSPPAAAGVVTGEREFAAEPVELLAKFAQMQGLKLIDLQVECR